VKLGWLVEELPHHSSRNWRRETMQAPAMGIDIMTFQFDVADPLKAVQDDEERSRSFETRRRSLYKLTRD
jgi:hypothetical protein